MTDERMALLELVEQQADGDLVREMLAFAADRIMEAEVETQTGAAKGVHSPLGEVLPRDKQAENGRMPSLIVDAKTRPSSSDLPATQDTGIGTYMNVPIWRGRTHKGCCFASACRSTGPSLSAISRFWTCSPLVGQRSARAQEENQQHEPLHKEILEIIKSNAYRTVFQPIKNIKTQQISGYEALTRFENGRRPDEVFKMAGQAQLQSRLETAVVKSAISHLPSLQEGCYLSINISGETFADPEFQATVLSARSERIVIELTEHDAIENYQELIDDLAPLRAAGVRLAVDDLGSGYASFKHVLTLLPDMIKLDRSLIMGLPDSQAKRAMVTAMVEFAAETGIALVGEGLEKEDECEAALQLGVEYGQGYLLGRPEEAMAN